MPTGVVVCLHRSRCGGSDSHGLISKTGRSTVVQLSGWRLHHQQRVCEYQLPAAVVPDSDERVAFPRTGGEWWGVAFNDGESESAWLCMVQDPTAAFPRIHDGVSVRSFQFDACRGCSFPADGSAPAIQNDPSGTGAIGYTGNGQNLSYGNNDVSTAHGPGAAILNSLAVELDTFQNSNYYLNGNHIAVQSCGPNNSSTLTPNSADHDYICPNGSVASLALQGLPSGLSLSDGLAHTITVNYLPPGSCTSGCNNLSVYFDSTLILQTTVDLTQQLNLTSGSNESTSDSPQLPAHPSKTTIS